MSTLVGANVTPASLSTFSRPGKLRERIFDLIERVFNLTAAAAAAALQPTIRTTKEKNN